MEKKRKKIKEFIVNENKVKGDIIRKQEKYILTRKDLQSRKQLDTVKKNYETRVKQQEKEINKKEKVLM